MKEDAIQLLKELLEIPSVNSKDREAAVAEHLDRYFRQHGIQSFIQPVDDNRSNVFAYVEGREPSVTELWNGHLDTVPYGELEKWRTLPQKAVLKDGKLYARGASDMKSGLSAMVYALTHLEEKPAHNILFVGTCDEEKNGLGAQKALTENRTGKYEFLLIGEPTGMKLGVAQKGCLWLQIRMKGRTSHGAYPQEGINAIHCMYDLTRELTAYVESFGSPLLGGSTAQIDLIQGGVAPNMTADICEAVLDIRMVPGLTAEMVLKKGEELLEVLQEKKPGLQAEWKILNDRRAFEIAFEDPDVSRLRGLLQKRGYEGNNIGINFFTDASILAKDRPEQKVLLFGPGDPALAHQPKECVEIEKYLDAIEILTAFAEGKK